MQAQYEHTKHCAHHMPTHTPVGTLCLVPGLPLWYVCQLCHRIQLNQGGASATDMLEMCGDASLSAAMAALSPPSTALAASGRSEAPILAPGLPAG